MAGGSGLLGTALTAALAAERHEVFPDRQPASRHISMRMSISNGLPMPGADVDLVLDGAAGGDNLAGESSIGDGA